MSRLEGAGKLCVRPDLDPRKALLGSGFRKELYLAGERVASGGIGVLPHLQNF